MAKLSFVAFKELDHQRKLMKMKRNVLDTPRRDLEKFLDEQSESDPIIDLLIIDEAHYLRNPETQTALVGQLLDRFRNM